MNRSMTTQYALRDSRCRRIPDIDFEQQIKPRCYSYIPPQNWKSKKPAHRHQTRLLRYDLFASHYTLPQTNSQFRLDNSFNKIEDYRKLIFIKAKFLFLKGKLENETKHISASIDVINHPAYQDIINLGDDVISILLEDMRVHHTHWFWALYKLTGENPVPPEDKGRIRKMIDAWLKWGKEHGYVQ